MRAAFLLREAHAPNSSSKLILDADTVASCLNCCWILSASMKLLSHVSSVFGARCRSQRELATNLIFAQRSSSLSEESVERSDAHRVLRVIWCKVVRLRVECVRVCFDTRWVWTVWISRSKKTARKRQHARRSVRVGVFV